MKTPLITLIVAATISMPALAQDRNTNPPQYSQDQTRPHNQMQARRKRVHHSMRRPRRGRPAVFPRRAKVAPESLNYPQFK